MPSPAQLSPRPTPRRTMVRPPSHHPLFISPFNHCLEHLSLPAPAPTCTSQPVRAEDVGWDARRTTHEDRKTRTEEQCPGTRGYRGSGCCSRLSAAGSKREYMGRRFRAWREHVDVNWALDLLRGENDRHTHQVKQNLALLALLRLRLGLKPKSWKLEATFRV